MSKTRLAAVAAMEFFVCGAATAAHLPVQDTQDSKAVLGWDPKSLPRFHASQVQKFPNYRLGQRPDMVL